ncbi:MAG: ATPase, T2SS/T4P/T4SS family [Planctomycetota bacterium]
MAVFFAVALSGEVSVNTAAAQIAVETLEATRQGADLQNRNTRQAQRAAGIASDEESNEEAAPEEDPADDTGDADTSDEAAPAGSSAPAVKFDEWNDEHSVYRSTKGYTSWLYVLLTVVGLLVWVRVGDWVNRDAQGYELGWQTWNLVAFLPGVLAFLTLFVLPAAASLPVLFLAGFVPLVVYAIRHNKAVESHERVFTRDWWKYEMAEMASGVGIKVKTEKQAAYAKGAAVTFEARGADEATQNKANLLNARQSPGFVVAKELIAQMVRRRGEQAMLDYRQDTVVVKHYIDGVWQDAPDMEREDGDVMLAVLKTLANLKPGERRAKQEGEIGAEFQGVDYEVELTTQGVKTGERVLVKLIDPAKKSLSTFLDLGMREKIRDQWSEVLGSESGLIVISAQPGAGLTTLTNVSLRETDRLMRDFFSVEDVNEPEQEIENLVVHTYDSKKGESPATIQEKLTRLYPNAYVCRDFVNPESAQGLIDEAKDGKLVVTCARASEAPEAILRLLKNKAPHRDVVETIVASINMRLIRLLCDACKVGYEPSPDLLKKLGIPAGKVTQLYRVPNEEETKKPCEKCGGLGYHGRTGLFELLVVNDKVREVLLKQPKMELLRKAARTAGMRNHQEEGILLVAKGATSLQELQRMLKG